MTDVETLVSKIELFDDIYLCDGVIEFVGIVERVEEPTSVSNGTKIVMNVLFVGRVEDENSVRTERNWQIQLTFFDDLIKKWDKSWMPNDIIHVDGALSVKLNSTFSSSKNVLHDLRCRQNTMISKLVAIVGYLKTGFMKERIENVNIYTASLVDNFYRIEIHSKVSYGLEKFKKNTKVRVEGVMKTEFYPYIIEISSLTSITTLSDKGLSTFDLARSVKVPTSKKMDFTPEQLRDLYTSDETLLNLTERDTTLEVYLYVRKIYRYQKLENKQDKFEFLLTNGSQNSIQVVVWNERAEELAHKIDIGMVIHLERPKVKKLSGSYNKGNFPVELRVDSQTVVEFIGHHKVESSAKIETVKTLKDVKEKGVCYSFYS